MTDESQVAEEILNNKNKNCLCCQFCNSLILKVAQGDYTERQFDLPLMHQKQAKDALAIETEPHRHFWLVPDMFTFENIGFSNTVDNRKFLICADCDMGPVGYHDIHNKQCYIALKRVRHVKDSPVAGTLVEDADKD